MVIHVNDRYEIRSDKSLNWMCYRLSEPREDGAELQWRHTGTYHGTLAEACRSLLRHEAIEDPRTVDSLEEAVEALRGMECELVEAVRDASGD